MKVICTKCGQAASSKCPDSRTVFGPQPESYFWHGVGYAITNGRLSVTMLIQLDMPEEEAMVEFIKRFKAIPDGNLETFVCKHNYQHTEDCIICGWVRV